MVVGMIHSWHGQHALSVFSGNFTVQPLEFSFDLDPACCPTPICKRQWSRPGPLPMASLEVPHGEHSTHGPMGTDDIIELRSLMNSPTAKAGKGQHWQHRSAIFESKTNPFSKETEHKNREISQGRS